jgi:hypothetical protein
MMIFDRLTSTRRTWYERLDGGVCCWGTLGGGRAEMEHSMDV